MNIRFLARLAAVSALLGWLAACSSHNTATSSATVRVVWPKDPETLCPVTLPNTYAAQAVSLLYQTLLVADGPSRQYRPWLASAQPRVERLDSVTLVHYQLHPAATWDNGQPVLASDVAFSLKVHNCPGLPNEGQRALFSFIEDIRLDANDPRAFTLVCRGYTSSHVINTGEVTILPEYLLDSLQQLRPLPLRRFTRNDTTLNQLPAVQQFQTFFNNPALWRDPRYLRGSGAYELALWNAGQQLAFVRKAKWWGQKAAPTPTLQAGPQRIEYHMVPNPATALLALRRGELDVYPNMSGPDFDRLQHSADSAKFSFYTPASFRVVVLETNTEHVALRDARVRRALGNLIDVEKLLKATQYGRGLRSTGIINPLEKWVYQDSLPLRAFAPAQTVSQLQQAGWQRQADGWHRPGQTGPVTLRLSYQAGDRGYETIGLLVQQTARQMGLDVSLIPTEGGLLSQQRREGKFELALRTLYGNPFSYDVRPLLHSSMIGENGANRTRFRNAEADRLMDAIVTAPDSATQARQLRRLQTVVYQQAPFLPLYFEPTRLVITKRLTNAQASGIEPGYSVTSLQAAGTSK